MIDSQTTQEAVGAMLVELGYDPDNLPETEGELAEGWEQLRGIDGQSLTNTFQALTIRAMQEAAVDGEVIEILTALALTCFQAGFETGRYTAGNPTETETPASVHG